MSLELPLMFHDDWHAGAGWESEGGGCQAGLTVMLFVRALD